jgi:hypothetical protein
VASLRQWLIGASLVLLGVILTLIAQRIVQRPRLAVTFSGGWGVESDQVNVGTFYVWNHADAAALDVRVYARIDGEQVAEQRGIAVSPPTHTEVRLRLPSEHFGYRADPAPLAGRLTVCAKGSRLRREACATYGAERT